jgi:hypothetical protein
MRKQQRVIRRRPTLAVLGGGCVQLAKSRVEVPADQDGAQVRVCLFPERLAAQAASAHDGSRGQAAEIAHARGCVASSDDTGIARVGAGGDAREHQSRRQTRRNILQRMHCDMNAPCNERYLQLLCENAG